MKYATETRLYTKNNEDIVTYFDEVKEQYSYILRKVYYIIRSNPKIKESSLNTELQNKYSISKRTAASIIKIVQGRINSVKESKKTEVKQKQYKLERISKKLEKLIPVLLDLKLKARENDIKDLTKYRNLKTKVAFLKIRKDKLVNKIKSLNHQLETNKFKIISKTIKGESKRGRKYNKMIHGLAYRTFLDRAEQICNRENVGLIKVSPAWTSWIAENKFCDKMKLNVHTGAAFVIARRGMNIKDVV